MHQAIVRQIEALGSAVSVHKIPASLLGTVGEFVELHAVNLKTEEVRLPVATTGPGRMTFTGRRVRWRRWWGSSWKDNGGAHGPGDASDGTLRDPTLTPAASGLKALHDCSTLADLGRRLMSPITGAARWHWIEFYVGAQFRLNRTGEDNIETCIYEFIDGTAKKPPSRAGTAGRRRSSSHRDHCHAIRRICQTSGSPSLEGRITEFRPVIVGAMLMVCFSTRIASSCGGRSHGPGGH